VTLSRPRRLLLPPAPAPQPQRADAGQVHSDHEEEIVVDTDLVRVFLEQRRGSQKAGPGELKDHDGKLLDLVNKAALAKTPAPFSLEFESQKPTADPNNALFKVDRNGDNLTPEPMAAWMSRKFLSSGSRVLARLTSRVSQNGVMLHSLEWRGGFGDETIINPAAVQHALLYDRMHPDRTESSTTNCKGREGSQERSVTSGDSTPSRALKTATLRVSFCPGSSSPK
jgi:hypothetical protein